MDDDTSSRQKAVPSCLASGLAILINRHTSHMPAALPFDWPSFESFAVRLTCVACDAFSVLANPRSPSSSSSSGSDFALAAVDFPGVCALVRARVVDRGRDRCHVRCLDSVGEALEHVFWSRNFAVRWTERALDLLVADSGYRAPRKGMEVVCGTGILEDLARALGTSGRVGRDELLADKAASSLELRIVMGVATTRASAHSYLLLRRVHMVPSLSIVISWESAHLSEDFVRAKIRRPYSQQNALRTWLAVLWKVTLPHAWSKLHGHQIWEGVILPLCPIPICHSSP